MKKLLLLVFVLSSIVSNSQTVSKKAVDSMLGTWIIDLRPTPSSEAYLKEFQFTKIEGKEFEGVFYDTPFTGGMLNIDWGKIYFAFTTGDQHNIYFHSGYIEGDKIQGLTYCETRKFALPWTGKRKTN